MREEDVLRGQLRQLVDDVEPRSDALAKLLAANRRRRQPRLLPPRLIAVAGVAVGATAVFLAVLLTVPAAPNPTPVSVRPNSYVAMPRPGVVASFDVATGRQLRQIAQVPGSNGTLVSDGDHVYTLVTNADTRRIVELAPNGVQRGIGSLRTTGHGVLAAEAGRIAYVDGDSVVVADRSGPRRRLPVPQGRQVIDLALDQQGRLAVLLQVEDSGKALVRVVEPTAGSLVDTPPLPPVGACGPLAIAWSGDEVAAVLPDDCDSTVVRIATLDRESGRQVGAGAPFDSGPRTPDVQLKLSVDRLGRFLLSTSVQRQWLVDGAEVRAVPPACSSKQICAATPGTFWG